MSRQSWQISAAPRRHSPSQPETAELAHLCCSPQALTLTTRAGGTGH
jgi:hypothetical protein